MFDCRGPVEIKEFLKKAVPDKYKVLGKGKIIHTKGKLLDFQIFLWYTATEKTLKNSREIGVRILNRCSHAQDLTDETRKLCFQRDRHGIGN